MKLPSTASPGSPAFGENVTRHLDMMTTVHRAVEAAAAGGGEGARARHIGRTIESVARFTPWNSNCLAQALVAALCLRVARIGFSVHFGMIASEKGAASIEAHSWVMAGAYPVTGYAESRGMTCLQTFALLRS